MRTPAPPARQHTGLSAQVRTGQPLANAGLTGLAVGGEQSEMHGGAVYLELPAAGDAAALVVETIGMVLAAERGRREAARAFRLHPVAAEQRSAAGRPYRVLCWGVFVVDEDYAVPGDPFAALVNYGAVRRRRDGELWHDRRSLHDPLDLGQLGRLLSAAGANRSGEDLLAEVRRLDPPRSVHGVRGDSGTASAALAARQQDD